MGLDFITALSGSASALANVGPGIGDVIGPTGNYSTLDDPEKRVLIIAMILGFRVSYELASDNGLELIIRWSWFALALLGSTLLSFRKTRA